MSLLPVGKGLASLPALLTLHPTFCTGANPPRRQQASRIDVIPTTTSSAIAHEKEVV
ncbi:MAG: hypothetical protein M3488_11410 [Actinomycetota bacterium]|nr:hypothetical protein [Actinomycetota bacterium]